MPYFLEQVDTNHELVTAVTRSMLVPANLSNLFTSPEVDGGCLFLALACKECLYDA